RDHASQGRRRARGMSALEVCLVRHGESVSNAAGVWQGQGDSPLNDKGRTQAEALGQALSGHTWDLAVSSDLSRAAETGRAVLPDLELDAAWREIHVGDWEGLTMDEVFKRYPEQIEALKRRETFAVGGGESWPEVFARADGALRDLRARLPEGGRAIVFTHGGIIAAIMAGLLSARGRWPWPLGRMRNTGRTTLRFEGDGIALLGHNDDSHVPHEHRRKYVPRSDQSVLRLLVGDDPERADEDPALLDFNSAIKVARVRGAGEVMSVSGTGGEVAALVQDTVGASVSDFRFVDPPEGTATELLVSPDHTMLLDYALA
ncbi:MAG: histidine phosphatase family protein, partial [Myxococcota bacterium]